MKPTERAASLQAVRRAQRPDGGFDGLASFAPDDFSEPTLHPTAFFTALIAGALAEVAGAASITQPAANYLLQHASPEWTWNYWERGVDSSVWRRYPDDLDDTACALAALARIEPQRITGAIQAWLAHTLLACEEAPGGPYRTWLVPKDAPAVWRDVDVAVNANIGFFLATQNVRSPALERYMADCLRSNTLTSPYYCGDWATLYFLSRWYRGENLHHLQHLVHVALADADIARHPLALAMSLSAGCNLHLDPAILARAQKNLLAHKHHDAWPAAALYYEPPLKGRPQYAGSSTLTTAFALEALCLYDAQRSPLARPQPSHTVSAALRWSRALPQEIRGQYWAIIRRVARGEQAQERTDMASIIAAALETPMSQATIQAANLGHFNGWVAYTLYDQLLDGEAGVEVLSVANAALRQAVAQFTMACPGDALAAAYVQATLDDVDAANAWELAHTRAVVANGRLSVSRLPDYGDMSVLARRAGGHRLAAVLVLRASGEDLKGASVRAIEIYFHHFVIAKQLLDDAHDWPDDLAQGRLTAVVVMLLKDYGFDGASPLDFAAMLPRLRRLFWDHTIDALTALIFDQTTLARRALKKCRALHRPEVLQFWLDGLEVAAKRAQAEREAAREFIASYKQI